MSDFEQKIRNMSGRSFDFDDLGESLGCPGWQYRDLPKLSPEYMQKFKQLVGKDNIYWITFATYSDGSQRGQLLVSPEGIEKIKSYIKSIQN